MKCSDMRQFGFFFFLLWVQNSVAQDFMGWPNFNSVPETIKNSETETPAARAKKAPPPQRQIHWQSWNQLRMYRYRTGSRYAGLGKWEHYVIFESRENVRFSKISCGPIKTPDISLSRANPVAKIVLLTPSGSRWEWNASLYSSQKKPENN